MNENGRELPDTPLQSLITSDAWVALKQHTAARIALGRTGVSLSSIESLNLKLAHSRARDAVEQPLDGERLAEELHALGHETISVSSRVTSAQQYLLRPDLGRLLSAEDVDRLPVGLRPDIVFVVTDGLSARAVQTYVVPLLAALGDYLSRLHVAPIVIAHYGRVALSDCIGEVMKAKLAISLIGERPGLSSFDSLGVYLTFGPRVGNTDEVRNCISNVRSDGLPVPQAADLIARLVSTVLAHGATGIPLQGKLASIGIGVSERKQLES